MFALPTNLSHPRGVQRGWAATPAGSVWVSLPEISVLPWGREDAGGQAMVPQLAAPAGLAFVNHTRAGGGESPQEGAGGSSPMPCPDVSVDPEREDAKRSWPSCWHSRPSRTGSPKARGSEPEPTSLTATKGLREGQKYCLIPTGCTCTGWAEPGTASSPLSQGAGAAGAVGELPPE